MLAKDTFVLYTYGSEVLAIAHGYDTPRIRGGANVICFMQRESAGLFSNLWEWIRAKVPNIRSNLKTIVCNSDDALELSIHASIPRAEIKRTWITVVRAIHRRWNTLDLPKRGSNLNQMLYYASALPFVPPGMMERATTVIEGMFAAHEQNHCQFREMSKFIRTDIVPQTYNFSIWTVPWKDRCPEEILNFALLSHFKENHPSMNTFIEKLPALIEKGSSLMEKEFKKND
ncbi:Protein of unknown function [Cotesia congregata]|uniref:Uncharacterized protein n=1 Tax=Cotesia congregata TaxID=51543 RepID=A0A8J2H716_COTCN|nr:Protein of unknown function [Cotesia congregata]